jgi:hypothetical protein
MVRHDATAPTDVNVFSFLPGRSFDVFHASQRKIRLTPELSSSFSYKVRGESVENLPRASLLVGVETDVDAAKDRTFNFSAVVQLSTSGSGNAVGSSTTVVAA